MGVKRCGNTLRIEREPAKISLKGHLSLTILNSDGSIADRREGDNVICTTGYTAFASALVWSGIQDQASNLGISISTFLTPLWGAIGTGAATPAKSDTQLVTEASRAVVTGGGSTPASPSVGALTTWLFYFPNPASNLTITEAGVFANATSAANTGTMLDHWAFSPNVSVLTTNTMILEVGFQFGP